MITWKLLLMVWILPCYQANSEGIYECGAHGRFEYCIDDIPGCVIGCHCHPGYYFDTETKICEPNTKLTQNYKRNYVPEPTRVQDPTFLSNVAQTELLPILTTHNVIDEHVNDITKNADDLGDWLYNQFFKTIENQVINNTNNDSLLTRRSDRGSLSQPNKLKRRARRKGNKHKKKKKGLQGKLLRIAEDDSLFQSSESSDSDSSSPDFYRSAASLESGSDEDHGHKKILLINKKPKPPLPSFIFLPNMNTPYYPPIGLPPPPVMPMYPMVPVPPMMPAPPLLPYPGHIPECDENSTIAPTKTTTISTTVTSTEEISTKTDSTIITTVETETPSTTVPAQRSNYRGRRRKKLKPHEYIQDEDDYMMSDIYEPSRGNRQKLLKLLREKINYPRMNDPSSKRQKKPSDKYMNQIMSPDIFMDNDLTDDAMLKDENSSPANIENTSELENVDFKYLSQLIHRVNQNQTQYGPLHDTNLQDSSKTAIPRKFYSKKYRDFNVPLNSGRRVNQYINTTRNQQADDSYYSNLGKQIATLIRSIDADKERQINIEIEGVQDKTQDHPYFNENGPRTFWERSVRSPLRFFHSFKNRFNKLRNSNELLFNIENKVETVASTKPTLSLHELENLINVMETARNKFQGNNNNNNKNVKTLNKSLNVNLWPQEAKQSKKIIKNSSNPNVSNIKRRKDFNYSRNTRPEVLRSKPNNMEVHYPFKNQVKLHKGKDVLINRGLQMQPTTNNISKIVPPIYKLKNQNALSSSVKRQHTMKPTILNYKNIKKYFFDNNNQYSFQNDNLQLSYLPLSKINRQKVNPLVPSPYFHHEISHVDYIS